jgi:DNA-binding transcriptional MerR regulator
VTERTFTIHEACAATGVTPVCLHQWIEREHFTPLHDPAPGLRREYALRDIVHIAAMVELARIGLPIRRAAQMLGTSPLDTAGRRTITLRQGDAEIRLALAPVIDRIRAALL